MGKEPNEPATPELLTDLTACERALIDAARRGKPLVCRKLSAEELAVSDDPNHVVRADFLRELLLGRRGQLDPMGVQLLGARIVNKLSLDSAHPVAALRLRDCVVDEPIHAMYATLPSLAVLGGRLAGLRARGVRINNEMILSNLLIQVVDSSPEAAIDLAGADIAGNLMLTNVTITHDRHCGLHAEGIHVGGDMCFRGNVQITGASREGALRLIGANIAGDLEIGEDSGRIKINNTTSGSALLANRIRVDGNVFLRGEIRFIGDIAIFLNGARIGAYFGARGRSRDADIQVITNSSKIMLNLEEMTVGTTLALPPDLLCPDQNRGHFCQHPNQVKLEHLSYGALGPELDWRRWLHVIRCHTPTYHASSYQRLATIERAAGHDGNARQILIAQQHDLRRRAPEALGGRLTRFFHWLWGVLAGYGYQARRTAAALLLVLVIAAGLGWWAGQVVTRPGHHAAERVAPSDTPAAAPGTPCSFIELVGLGLDRGLPLGLTGLRSRCDLDTASRKGQVFTGAIWGIQLAVWGLATLALAGYTNLVRKTS